MGIDAARQFADETSKKALLALHQLHDYDTLLFESLIHYLLERQE